MIFPFRSLLRPPFNVTVEPAPTVWSGPASATGTVEISNVGLWLIGGDDELSDCICDGAHKFFVIYFGGALRQHVFTIICTWADIRI